MTVLCEFPQSGSVIPRWLTGCSGSEEVRLAHFDCDRLNRLPSRVKNEKGNLKRFLFFSGGTVKKNTKSPLACVCHFVSATILWQLLH